MSGRRARGPKKYAFLADGGLPQHVLRPLELAKAQAHIASARALVGQAYDEAQDAFNEIILDGSSMLFVGYLAVHAREALLVDKEGVLLGKCEPGDSFVTINDAKIAAMLQPGDLVTFDADGKGMRIVRAQGKPS